MQLSRRSLIKGLGATFAVVTSGFIPPVATAAGPVVIPPVDPSIIEIVQKAIKTALEQHLFEFNDDTTRLSVTKSINGYLAPLKASGQMHDFAAICDASNNNEHWDHNELHVDVYVKPKKSVEFLLFNSTVSKEGAEFQIGDGRLFDEDDMIIGANQKTYRTEARMGDHDYLRAGAMTGNKA